MRARKMLIFSPTLGNFFIRLNEIDVNFHLQFFLEMFDKKSADTFCSKIKGGGKCLPSCQLGQKQLLPLFSECAPETTCTGANRECDGATNDCKCKSGYVENPDIADPGDADACVQGRITLTTDEANPQVSKDLEKCQKLHISS